MFGMSEIFEYPDDIFPTYDRVHSFEYKGGSRKRITDEEALENPYKEGSEAVRRVWELRMKPLTSGRGVDTLRRKCILQRFSSC